MVGITEFSALLTSLKSAKDIAEAMVSLRDTAAFQGKVIEFQTPSWTPKSECLRRRMSARRSLKK